LIDGAPAHLPSNPDMEQFHGTTIMSARRDGKVALGGDGQVTLGNVVVKASARKVRRLYHDRILAGFAGGPPTRYAVRAVRAKLDKHQGNLLRSAVELAKDWRTDRVLRRLEAMLAWRPRISLIITGLGDVIEPELGLIAIGSEALTRRRLRARSSKTPARRADRRSQALSIAADLCIYTNQQIFVETLD